MIFNKVHTSPVDKDHLYPLKKPPKIEWLVCDSAGTRTQDPNIKSVMLYRLSYGIISLTAKMKKFGKDKVLCQTFQRCGYFLLDHHAISNEAEFVFGLSDLVDL